MALDLSPAYSAFECGTLGLAYNEIAFRHFLDIERRRAERSRRALLLLLVHFKTIRMSRAPLGHEISSQVFKALGGCVREVDFVGWHREGKVAGAVVALGGGASADVQRLIAGRVGKALAAHLSKDQVTQLRVRIVRLCGEVSH